MACTELAMFLQGLEVLGTERGSTGWLLNCARWWTHVVVLILLEMPRMGEGLHLSEMVAQ